MGSEGADATAAARTGGTPNLPDPVVQRRVENNILNGGKIEVCCNLENDDGRLFVARNFI